LDAALGQSCLNAHGDLSLPLQRRHEAHGHGYVEAKKTASFLKKEAKDFYSIRTEFTADADVDLILIDKVFLLLFFQKKKTPLRLKAHPPPP